MPRSIHLKLRHKIIYYCCSVLFGYPVRAQRAAGRRRCVRRKFSAVIIITRESLPMRMMRKVHESSPVLLLQYMFALFGMRIWLWWRNDVVYLLLYTSWCWLCSCKTLYSSRIRNELDNSRGDFFASVVVLVGGGVVATLLFLSFALCAVVVIVCHPSHTKATHRHVAYYFDSVHQFSVSQ